MGSVSCTSSWLTSVRLNADDGRRQTDRAPSRGTPHPRRGRPPPQDGPRTNAMRPPRRAIRWAARGASVPAVRVRTPLSSPSRGANSHGLDDEDVSHVGVYAPFFNVLATCQPRLLLLPVAKITTNDMHGRSDLKKRIGVVILFGYDHLHRHPDLARALLSPSSGRLRDGPGFDRSRSTSQLPPELSFGSTSAMNDRLSVVWPPVNAIVVCVDG